MEKLKVIVIGAGMRGKGYSDIMAMYPDKFEVVGVAEPVEDKREYMRTKHNIPAENCFDTWEKILDVPKFADVAIIATMDRMHTEPAIKAANLKYHLLLEKPAAPTPEECIAIKNAADENGVKVLVCHVLRYTPFYGGIKKLLDDGIVGEIISINHTEGVGNVHQSHSFVRGNWGNEARSSSMLLQKSCHDLDLIQWLTDKQCTKIQSFGSLTHFTADNAPEGAPERCTDGCPHAETCYYNSIKHYYDNKDNAWFRTVSTQMTNPTDEDVMEALKTTQYGKCVYKCDNDVVDHQIVNMEFEDKMTVTFSMNAFDKGGRRTEIVGTKGALYASMEGETVEFYSNAERKSTSIDITKEKHGESIVYGHGGGDQGIVLDLYDYITGALDGSKLSEIGISCKNHMLVFAAEEARLNHSVVDIAEFNKKYYK
ncbi:MAG: Gfo/Idh/MocA family oxidoreductase [Clostridia bacterium]|nr:Gfo/Idh/MocA family oxidoreductase [Clostridia bacterium]